MALTNTGVRELQVDLSSFGSTSCQKNYRVVFGLIALSSVPECYKVTICWIFLSVCCLIYIRCGKVQSKDFARMFTADRFLDTLGGPNTVG